MPLYFGRMEGVDEKKMEEEDFSKLSTEDACAHKVWKARLIGYEAVAKQLELIEDEKSNDWNKYTSILRKSVVDSHALCQEKGLEAVLIYVENCASAGKTTECIVNGIIQKCLSAPKARTKELAGQIILMYIEIEKYEIVFDELMKGTESKNPRVVAACVRLLTQGLMDYGLKVINVSRLLKRATALLEERDLKVREETKYLVLQLLHWVGPSIKPQLASTIKPQQLSEIEAEYEKIKNTPARANKLFRSQQAKQAALASGDKGENAGGEVSESDGASEEIDPFELLEAVDILSKMNKEFYIKHESKKWIERKEVLDELEKLLLASPKLENGDYGQLVRALQKTIQKDSNIVVVGFAIRCITGLARGLKKKFHPYSSVVMPTLFERFKEKKQAVVTALRDAVDAVYVSTSLELLQEELLGCLQNKNPSIKSETCEFLNRCFLKATPIILNKKILKPLAKGLANELRDQDPCVRNNAAMALGTAMKVVGEKGMGPFLVDIDAQIMKKIKDFCEKAELTVKSEKPCQTEKKSQSSSETIELKSKPVNKCKPVRPLAVKSQSAGTKIKLLTREAALSVAKNLVPKEMYDGLLCDQEEIQVNACRRLKEVLSTIPVNDDSGQALLALFQLHDFTVPGKNLITRIEVLKLIADKFILAREGMELILFDVSNHLSNPDLKTDVSELLTIFARKTSLTLVAKAILGSDDDLSNVDEDQASLLAEKLNWVSSGLMSIDVVDDPTFLFDLGKKASIHANANVRNAALALIGTLHLKGDSIVERPQVERIHDTQPKSESPPQKEEPPVVVPEKAPEQTKIDIGSKITENLISELGDKNWKVRAEAISKLQQIFNSSSSITGHLGDAAPLIAARIHDSNAKISGSAIALVESIAPAMGPSCKKYIPVFLPALMKAIGDQKVWIRSAVIPCLNTWGDIIGYEKFFEGEMIADALKSGSPAVRAELWSWLSVKLPDIPPKSITKEELSACLPVLFSNFEDRNAEVRKNAIEAALGFMLHLGYNSMAQALDNIKGSGSSARAIKDLLDKTRGSLPIVPLQKSKSGPTSDKSGARPSSIKVPQPPSTAPVKQKTVRGSTAHPKTAPSGTRSKQAEDDAPLLQSNNLKHQRVIDEQKLKILKWNFHTPRPEFIDLLKELMCSANMNKTLIANMFHADFRYHLRAIENLAEDLDQNKDATKCNLDLILKWMTLRFFDTNPSVLLKGLEYLSKVFTMLIADQYTVLDSEANAFIPYLILKVGDPKDTVRNSVREILKQIASVYPASKQFSFLADGVKCKNARQRSECLDQMAWLIENYGVAVCHPSPPVAIREISKHIGDRDHTVRNAAINCVVVAYFLEGEKVLKMIDKMSEKDSSLLEERIKRAAKTRPLNVVKPLTPVEAIVKPLNITPEAEMEEEPPINQANITADLSPRQHEPEPVVHQNRQYELPSRQMIRPTSGAYGFDRTIFEDIESVGPHFQAPKLLDIDLQFLKDSGHQSSFKPIQMQRMTPTLSNFSQPNAIKRELVNIASSDIDKAMSAISRIDTIILSDKWPHLLEFADHLVCQLNHLIIILNQSAHPEVVNCYNATFSLFMKFCNCKELCSQVTEGTLYTIIEQFLLLLTEPRLDSNQNMFGRVVNNLIIKFLEQSNKTNVMCALFKILYNSVSNPKVTNHFKDLLVKCLWKLNKSQPEWDSELDYVRVLTEFNTFLKDYPTAWWKNEEYDFPLRTVKTVLHTMVKIRGCEVRDLVDGMPNVPKDSELYSYIKKVIKHLKVEENNPNNRESCRIKEKDSAREPNTYKTAGRVPSISRDASREPNTSKDAAKEPNTSKDTSRETNTSKDSPITRDNVTFLVREVTIGPHRLTKEVQDELSSIFRKIGDSNETSQGMRMLAAFIKAHPEADVEPFISKGNSNFQQYVRRGLRSLEEQQRVEATQDVNHKEKITVSEPPAPKKRGVFSEEAEAYWSKLKSLKEKSGCELETEKNKEELSETAKEAPTTAIEPATEIEPSEIDSLKQRFAKLKLKNKK